LARARGTLSYEATTWRLKTTIESTNRAIVLFDRPRSVPAPAPSRNSRKHPSCARPATPTRLSPKSFITAVRRAP